MTFKEFLIEKNISFIEFTDGNIGLDDKLLIPYERKFRELFPNEELIWDYKRYRCEPGNSTSDRLNL